MRIRFSTNNLGSTLNPYWSSTQWFPTLPFPPSPVHNNRPPLYEYLSVVFSLCTDMPNHVTSSNKK